MLKVIAPTALIGMLLSLLPLTRNVSQLRSHFPRPPMKHTLLDLHPPLQFGEPVPIFLLNVATPPPPLLSANYKQLVPPSLTLKHFKILR